MTFKQSYIGLLSVLLLGGCNGDKTPSKAIQYDISSADTPSDISSWAGYSFVFKDGSCSELHKLDQLANSTKLSVSGGETVAVVAYDSNGNIALNEGASGKQSGIYCLSTISGTLPVPRVWAGVSTVSAETDAITQKLSPVTSTFHVKVTGAPSGYSGLSFVIPDCSDAYYPELGQTAALKDAVKISYSSAKSEDSFNIMPMVNPSRVWSLSVKLSFGGETYTAVLEGLPGIGSGKDATVAVDFSELEGKGIYSVKFSLSNPATGSTEFSSSVSNMAVPDSDSENYNANRHYNVFVKSGSSWVPLKVRDALCSDAGKHAAIWNDWGNAKAIRDTMSYCIIENDFTGPVQIRVQKRTGSFSSCEVRPTLWGITANSVGDNLVEFSLPSFDKRKVSVEFDGDRFHNLFIFANKPDSDKPSASSADVMYFGPGEHDAGTITLKDNQTCYVDAGAIVYGKIIVEGNNCAIAGNGVFSGAKLRHWGGTSWSNGEILITCNQSRVPEKTGLTIKDVTFIDGPSWNISVFNYNNVLIDGANTISWELNGDGIDIGSSHGVEIKNCFLRNYDDCITLKVRFIANPISDVYDVRIHDNLIWNDYARGIVVGPEAGSQEDGTGYLHDIDIRDCTFLHHKNGAATDDLRAAFAIGQHNFYAGASNNTSTAQKIKNITASGLVFDNIAKTGRNISIVQFSGMQSTCEMDNVTLENFTILDGNNVTTPAVYINANQHKITGLHLNNIVFKGQKISAIGDECVVKGDVDVDFK